MLKFFFGIFLMIFYVQNSRAVFIPPPLDSCQDGSTWAGTFRFNSGAIEYCDGASMWGSVDNGTTGVGCTVGQTGHQRFNSGTMQFCNGTSWRTMDVCASDTTCTKTGAMFASPQFGGRSYFCDGSVWHTMAPNTCNPTLSCRELATSKDCSDKGSCFWTGFYCGDPNDCATFYESSGCNAAPFCTWLNGACGTSS